MIDFHRPRDLHHRLIEKTVQVGGFACGAAVVDQDEHMATDFLQFQRLLTGRCIVHYGLTLASRNGAKGRSSPLRG